MARLEGKTIAFLVATERVEQVELTDPWAAVEEAGGTPKLLSVESGKVQAFNHLDKGDTFGVDAVVGDADASSYDAEALRLRAGQGNVRARSASSSRNDRSAPASWYIEVSFIV